VSDDELQFCNGTGKFRALSGTPDDWGVPCKASIGYALIALKKSCTNTLSIRCVRPDRLARLGPASIPRWDERHSTTEEPFMSQDILKSRSRAFAHQNGRCCYCRFPMWQKNIVEFAARHGISEREARRFQCTAEHLTARQDGGTNAPENIAAACLHCNLGRQRRRAALSSEDYRRLVVRRIKHGKWHPQ